MTSKKEPPTTPAFTVRGSPLRPINVNSAVENSPNAPMAVTRDFRSMISGTENVVFSAPRPGALCRM